MKLPEQDQSLSLAVWANPSITEPTISGGVPAQLLTVTIEGQDRNCQRWYLTIPPTCIRMVRFTNLTGEE